ncbi:uncharacterized protein LOC124120676 [Haliotis rufescens]|uniref:uncharacterized protein LOC124120676 n=1 Tax=Haliotis rufescens TaxID=6454 RepID=UPI00201F16D3|nr:uncharacterized protein LOC124120676 [Haliotis rufescens]
MKGSTASTAFICFGAWILGVNGISWLKTRVSGTTIQKIADRNLDSTQWSFKSAYKTGKDTNKNSIFVADVFKKAGVIVPQINNWWSSPIGAGEWGNPNSSYLKGNSCWSQVSTPGIGDVISDGQAVAIVTGQQKTTRATLEKVVKDDWGFLSDSQNIVFWHYSC